MPPENVALERGDHCAPSSSPTRRQFLRYSAGSLLVTHPMLSSLARYGENSAQPSPVKSIGEYRAEAALFETAFRDFATVLSMSAVASYDASRLTTLVEKAGHNLDHMHSWMVMVCFNDPGLVAWVRKEIRDEASAVKFLNDVRRNPRVVDAIPAVSALSARLDQLKAEKVAIITSIVAAENRIAGTEALSARATKQAAADAECQKTWSIVEAIVVIVVAIIVAVIATVSAALSFGAGTAAGTALVALATAYAGTGAEAVAAKLKAINSNYRTAVTSSSTAAIAGQSQTSAALAKAIAARQAAWLSDKAVFLT